jgi:hypothetical protein
MRSPPEVAVELTADGMGRGELIRRCAACPPHGGNLRSEGGSRPRAETKSRFHEETVSSASLKSCGKT